LFTVIIHYSSMFMWYPVCKEEKLEVILFVSFFLIRVMRFGDLEFVEHIHQYNSRMVGRELSCKRVGPWISIRPTSPPLTLAAPLFSPLGIAAAPLPSPFSWTLPPPLSHLLPPQTLAALTTQNPSPPPHVSAPPPRCSPPAWFSVVWLRSQLEFGGRKEEGKNSRWICD
jgi:hypothetical protein